MIRLFVSNDLSQSAEIAPTAEQSHYLTGVMRLRVGDRLQLFNGRDGEWSAQVAALSKRSVGLIVEARIRAQESGPDLDLVVALVKRSRLDSIVEKAAELGARRVRLVTTRRTNADHTNIARLTAIATEAAEQTGRLDVPKIFAPERLDHRLEHWADGRKLMFCDEAGDAMPALEALRAATPGPWAILIGPEGGFSPEERDAIRALAETVPVTLGPRILRADTAALAALTLWQAALGDWRWPP